jgi:hypothetical protein
LSSSRRSRSSSKRPAPSCSAQAVSTSPTASDHAHRRFAAWSERDAFRAKVVGIRDGVEVEWDIAAVPHDGGLPACDAIVRS